MTLNSVIVIIILAANISEKKLFFLTFTFSNGDRNITCFTCLLFQAELVGLRSGMTEAQAKVSVLEKELKNALLQLHAVQLQLHSTGENNAESDKIKAKLVGLY